MKNIGKSLKSALKGALLAGLVVLGVIGTVKAASSIYQRVQASAVEFFSSTGAKRWMWNLDSSSNLQLTENSNIGAAVLKVTTANGTLQIRNRTTAQTQAMTPSAAGELVFNSTIGAFCVSTGTVQNAWAQVGNTETAKIACSKP